MVSVAFQFSYIRSTDDVVVPTYNNQAHRLQFERLEPEWRIFVAFSPIRMKRKAQDGVGMHLLRRLYWIQFQIEQSHLRSHPITPVQIHEMNKTGIAPYCKIGPEMYPLEVLTPI